MKAKLCSIFTALIIAVFACNVIYVSWSAGAPIGADYYFHVRVAEAWARGENGMFSQAVFQMNNFPYPPVFHFLLLPSVWLDVERPYAVVLQVLLPILIVISAVILVRRRCGEWAGLITALVLPSSYAFVDAALQPRPETLDMLLVVVTLWLFTASKPKGWLFTTSLLAWNHGLAGIANYWVLPFYNLRSRHGKAVFLVALAVVVPILVLSVVYLRGLWGTWGGFDENLQVEKIISEPFSFVPRYCGASLPCFILVPYVVATWHRQLQLAKSAVLMVLGSMVMAVLWPDRFLQYATLPLSIIAGSTLSGHRNLRVFVVSVAALFFVWFTFKILLISLCGYWDTR